VLFAAVTLVPAIGLAWLGTTLIKQDRELAEKQLRDRLERSADAIAADIASDIAIPSGQGTGIPRVTDDEQASALIRRARELRTAGRSDEALAVWDQMKHMDAVHVFDMPASLQAGLARVRELGARSRTDERDREAAAIRQDLERGRWRIDQPTMEAAWLQVAAPDAFASIWLNRWRKDGVAVVLADVAGKPVVESGPLAGLIVSRHPNESGLPWTLRVASGAPDVELAAFGSRRRDLLLVLSLAAFLALAGAYFVARGVRRELAVAELQSNFVSAVSHEFRTPLTSMSHLIELLRDRTGMDDARRARYYDALEQEAGRLRRFVDQLLDFGRVNAGAVRYRFERTDPRTAVEEALDRFRSGPGARGHAVTCDAGNGMPDVEIDREAFALALNNLLENAAKYSPETAPIEVGVTADPDATNLMVTVRDRGPGIPRSEHQMIFDKFVRGAQAQASGVRGTGVGLALAREIVRAHGGNITVESDLGTGSTFTIVLPITRDRQSEDGRRSTVDVRS
jgi:signal transduction histidine kinase